MIRSNKPPPSAFIPYYDVEFGPLALHDVDEDPVQPKGISVFEHPIMDHWIHAEPKLPQREEMKKVKIVG